MLGVLAAAMVPVAVAGAWWTSHDRFVRRRGEIEAAWADVEAELTRRHELVPRLIDAVRETAVHERALLVEAAQRTDAARIAPHTPEAASLTEAPLSEAIARIVALRHRYPELDSQRNFLDLQRRLALTEDRIAASRRFYNTRVEDLNRRVDAVPSSFVASRHGFGKAEFFDA